MADVIRTNAQRALEGLARTKRPVGNRDKQHGCNCPWPSLQSGVRTVDMNLTDMISQSWHDLALSRGRMPGSRQRAFRVYFLLVRMNSLGRRPPVGRSLVDVGAFVLDEMRQRYQGFTPEMA
jgi:hypothetical protein